MNVFLVSIGDELLLGQTVNTNAAWMGRALTADGWRVQGVACIPDTSEAIVSALDRHVPLADVVVLTGGLGPTQDDITKSTLASYFGMGMVFHEAVAARIEAWFCERNVPFLEANRLQAMLPDGCTVLPNSLGTASGMWFEAGEGKVVVSLPGVPYEMEGLMTEEVVPRLRARFALPTTLYHTVSTAGMGESSLATLLEEWEAHVRAKGMSMAYLPSPGQVKLRLGVTGPAEARAALEAELADEVASLVSLVRPYLLGHGELGVAEAVLQALAANGQTVATAESCTGGTIASMLTAIPGASASMWGGVVAYDNRVKEAVLKVPEALLRAHGAVSEPVVIAMAERGRRELGTTWAVATSGVAGPSGGTPDKPVGMVWMAVAGPDGVRAWCHHLGRVRERIVERASRRALTHLFLAIQEGGVKGLED